MSALGSSRVLYRRAVYGLRLGAEATAFKSPPLSRSHRLSPSDDELYQKTTVTLLQREAPEVAFIESYSQRGFTINGDRVLGPCALLPRAVLQWNVGTYKDISEDSLSLFYLLEPKIEILVLGTGDRVERLEPRILEFMKKKRIAVEVQDTANACATFNFLTSERRITAAGLIPPPSAGQ
ncbi:NADH dehydrogenase [ubiquinone] 1 alpha subcomplex assembly factor 3 [Acipenser ruthenus]|uniref:NADH dehydrogenase [ubiquinone] 1 alpha subcomplex assembly factor 3 n=1 Tax=Acipenser ruthenus TaxID=7906 RepID=UPI00145A23E7|nr:NADH dehydrogenase [ubiquinone] 1 alpha subcomplex assembly factor 3 [Acipenser ruthenus]